MKEKLRFLGLDVHAETIAVAIVVRWSNPITGGDTSSIPTSVL
jgi:hypothetical protein